jgi:hypothetical protein
VRVLGARLLAWLRARGVWLIWPVAGLLVVLYMAHQAFGLGGTGADELFEGWLNDALLWASAAACLIGAVRVQRGRAAWLLVAAALACWAIGDTIWSVRFGPSGNGPLTSISDVFWIAWYPLILVAMPLLVRDRVEGFELHRWIDGVAVMLLVTIPWVAVFLAPVHAHQHISALADAVDFVYPLGNAIVFGAVLGVFAVTSWRPGRMWLVLGLGLAISGTTDSIYAIQSIEHVNRTATYSAAWALGALIVAYASWQPHPGRLKPREVYGWRAIALPLTAQALAAGVQTYGIFHELPRSERVLTLIVLLIATVQIVVTRPRRARAPDSTTEQEPVERVDTLR